MQLRRSDAGDNQHRIVRWRPLWEMVSADDDASEIGLKKIELAKQVHAVTQEFFFFPESIKLVFRFGEQPV